MGNKWRPGGRGTLAGEPAHVAPDGLAASDHMALAWTAEGVEGPQESEGSPRRALWYRDKDEWAASSAPFETLFGCFEQLCRDLGVEGSVRLGSIATRRSVQAEIEWLTAAIIILGGHLGWRVRVPGPPGRKEVIWEKERRRALRKLAEYSSRTQDKAGDPAREARVAELRGKYSEETRRRAE